MFKSIPALRTELAQAQANYARCSDDAHRVSNDYFSSDPSGCYDLADVGYYRDLASSAWREWQDAEERLEAALALAEAKKGVGKPLTAPLGQVARITHWATA